MENFQNKPENIDKKVLLETVMEKAKSIIKDVDPDLEVLVEERKINMIGKKVLVFRNKKLRVEWNFDPTSVQTSLQELLDRDLEKDIIKNYIKGIKESYRR